MKKLCCVVFICLYATFGYTDMPPLALQDFRAEFVIKGDGSEQMMTVYASPEAMRIDVAVNIFSLSTIVRYEGDAITAYGIMEATKQIVVMPEVDLAAYTNALVDGYSTDSSLDHIEAITRDCDEKGLVCELQGTELIHGRATTKWFLEDFGNIGATTLWIDDELRYPLQQHSATMDMTLVDIEVAPQADSLFELPQGYARISVPDLAVPTF